VSRPRCDPADFAAIAQAIEAGETSERKAYMAYASTAARPYARSTFTIMLRRCVDMGSIADPGSIAEPELIAGRWRERIAVKPRIIALGPGCSLRVYRGALIASDDEMRLAYTKAAKPPSAIVLATTGGYVSIEAVRFCARGRIAIVALDRAHGFLSVMSPGGPASAASIRAQCAAGPLPIARAIVAAKLDAMGHVGALASIERYAMALDRTTTLDQVRIVEAQASRVAWASPPRMSWERGPIPVDFAAPWLMRSRLDAKGKRFARHPINAMLNAAFAVTAGRLATYLAALGFAPSIGFLHADKRGRHSLAWDAIEPLRPMIEARVFRLVEQERFDVRDFERDADGSLRLASPCLRLVLNEAMPPTPTLSRCVKWVAGLIEGEALDPVYSLAPKKANRSALSPASINGPQCALLSASRSTSRASK
jgi:CRISPR-associated protein Cas1